MPNHLLQEALGSNAVAPVQPPQGVPTGVLPGGEATQPQDPAAPGAQVTVLALKQLAEMYRMLGDERLANFTDGLAVRLNKEHLKRQKGFEKIFEQAQLMGLAA